MVEQGTSSLDVSVPGSLVPRFFFLLQAGFHIRTEVDCSVGELLCDHLGLAPSYVNERISTLFLDGRPVDDFETAVVRDGSVLALSGALPGLVGATMRRGSFYACLREGISYRPGAQSTAREFTPVRGTITLKLFNLVLQDLGPRFLREGILVEADELLGLLQRQAVAFWHAAPQFVLNGEPVRREAFQSGQRGRLATSILLRVIPSE
jgi:hypothetical protein